MKKTKLLAILLSIVILPVFQIPVYAEEIVDIAENAEVSKNWNYYSTLDDYSVYCEYCNEHGYEIQDKLPTRGELPDYNYLHYGIKSGSTLKYADFTFILSDSLSDEKYYNVRYNMNYFGFPEEWCKIEEQNDDYYTPSSIEILNYGGSICIQLRPTEYTQKLEDNVINAYRIDLTVRNSEFGKEYPIIYTQISHPMDIQSSDETKNWNYYSNLDDYSVYCEYCNEHGYEIQDKLPTRGELPDYGALHYGVNSSTLKYAEFEFILSNSLSEEKYYDVRYNMNYFGFPEEWCYYGRNDDYYTPSSIEILNFGGSICIELQPTEYTQKLEDNVINAYRIDLTVRNSEFGKEYPIIYTQISKPLRKYQTGDVDSNEIVDIVDVLALNQYLLGIYQPSDAGIDAADVDHNGKVEDADSMKILKSLVGLETLE